MSLNRGEMLCWTGHLIHLDRPSIEEIYLEDISHPLSQLCRYSGGTVRFYSVAQHSLNCYRLCREFQFDEKAQLYLLLHDASEAYLSDVPTPVKKLLPDYLEIESGLMDVIYKRFNLDTPNRSDLAIINRIDAQMLAYEIPNLIPNLDGIQPNISLMDIELDFKERDHDKIRKEFEDTVKLLSKHL